MRTAFVLIPVVDQVNRTKRWFETPAKLSGNVGAVDRRMRLGEESNPHIFCEKIVARKDVDEGAAIIGIGIEVDVVKIVFDREFVSQFCSKSSAKALKIQVFIDPVIMLEKGIRGFVGIEADLNRSLSIIEIFLVAPKLKLVFQIDAEAIAEVEARIVELMPAPQGAILAPKNIVFGSY